MWSWTKAIAHIYDLQREKRSSLTMEGVHSSQRWKNIRPMAQSIPHTCTYRKSSFGCKINFPFRVINLLMKKSLERVIPLETWTFRAFHCYFIIRAAARTCSGSRQAMLDLDSDMTLLCAVPEMAETSLPFPFNWVVLCSKPTCQYVFILLC